MKLAIHSPRSSYYMGGAERYILNYSLWLQKLGENVSFITYDSPIKSKWFIKFQNNFKGNLILVKSKKMDKNFHNFLDATTASVWDIESLLFSNESKRFYKKNKFDLIILHYAVDGINLPKEDRMCLHLHGLPDKKRVIEERAIKIPDKIIAVSNYVGNGWRKIHNIKKKIFVIPNGINLINKPKKYKRNIDIISFGRLTKIKGLKTLIKAIFILKNDFKDLKLEIIGEGPEREKLIRLTDKLKLSKNIIFLHRISDKLLIKKISSSKIAVFPSYAREGIMTTLLEASLFGAGIVASNACSNKEFIKNDHNGLLFKSKDSSDLASKLKILLNNKKKLNKLKNNSYKKLKKFSWENQTKKIIIAYNK